MSTDNPENLYDCSVPAADQRSSLVDAVQAARKRFAQAERLAGMDAVLGNVNRRANLKQQLATALAELAAHDKEHKRC